MRKDVAATQEVIDDVCVEGDTSSPLDPMATNLNQEPEGSNLKRANLNPQIRGDPPVLMSNTELFDQIANMSNTINSMAARMETLEKEKRFMMGSQRYLENRNNSVGEKYQFGYELHYHLEDPHNEKRRMIGRGSHRPPKSHRLGRKRWELCKADHLWRHGIKGLWSIDFGRSRRVF